MDLALYTNATDAVRREVNKLYIAKQQDKAWKIFFISELEDVSEDQIIIDPEPGEYSNPILVSARTRSTQPFVYSFNGSDPMCPPSGDRPGVYEVELLVDRTSELKLKNCTDGLLKSTLTSVFYFLDSNRTPKK